MNTDQLQQLAQETAKIISEWEAKEYGKPAYSFASQRKEQEILTGFIHAALEKAYAQGGSDRTKSAIDTFLPMVKQEIAKQQAEPKVIGGIIIPEHPPEGTGKAEPWTIEEPDEVGCFLCLGNGTRRFFGDVAKAKAIADAHNKVIGVKE